MADVRYLREQASACRQAARVTTDRRESDDLNHLARLYDRQVQQLASGGRRRQAQG